MNILLQIPKDKRIAADRYYKLHKQGENISITANEDNWVINVPEEVIKKHCWEADYKYRNDK